MENEQEWKQLKNKDGVLLYEGFTLYEKPYGNGKKNVAFRLVYPQKSVVFYPIYP